MNLSLSGVVVLLLYLAAITAFGTYLGRKRKSVDDYFLASRSVPWWAIAAAVVATETSTLTFTSVPGVAYTGDWSFLQLALGYILGSFIVATLLTPPTSAETSSPRTRALGDVLPAFAPYGFLRVHRNHAVNLARVREIRRRTKGGVWELKLERLSKDKLSWKAHDNFGATGPPTM